MIFPWQQVWIGTLPFLTFPPKIPSGFTTLHRAWWLIFKLIQMEEALRILFYFFSFWFFQSREYTWHMKSDYIGEDSNKLRLQNFPNYRRNRRIIKLNENKRVHLMILLIWLQEKLAVVFLREVKNFWVLTGELLMDFQKLEVYIIRRVGEKYT